MTIRNTNRPKYLPGPDVPVSLGTCHGTNHLTETVKVGFGRTIGQGSAHIAPDSIEVDSAGRHIHDNKTFFLWSHSRFQEPVFADLAGLETEVNNLVDAALKQAALKLEVDGFVPVIVTPEVNLKAEETKAVTFASAADSDAQHKRTPRKKKGAQKSVSKKEAIILHSPLTHMPASPDTCDICLKAKMKKKAAYRLDPDTKSEKSYVATEFNELKSVDLVDPGEEDLHGNTFLFTTRDDATGWANVIAIKTKSAADTADALIEDARESDGNFSTAYRSDCGKEFLGEFDAELKKRVIKCHKGLPYRSTTDSRHERFHATLQPGTRAALLQSGLIYPYYSYAASHFTHNYVRSSKTGMDQKTAYERRYAKPFAKMDKLHPFGCRAIYWQEPTERRKYDATGAEGILIGYKDGGYLIMNTRSYIDTKGRKPKIITTRDVKFHDDVYPMANTATDIATFESFVDTVQDHIPKCNHCGLWLTDTPVTCKPCNGAKRGRHANDHRCMLNRCSCYRPAEQEADMGDDDIIITYEHIVEQDNSDLESCDERERAAIQEFLANEVLYDDFAEADIDISAIHEKLEAYDDDAYMLQQLYDNTLVPDNLDIISISSDDSDIGESYIGTAASHREAAIGDPRYQFFDNERLPENKSMKVEVLNDSAHLKAGAQHRRLALAAIRYAREIEDEFERKHLAEIRHQQRIVFGGVVREIQRKDPEWNMPEAQEAIKTELNKLLHILKVAEFDKPKEWSDIAEADTTAERVGFKIILGIKHSELSKDKWKFKARGCATGNYVVDSSGYQIYENRDELTGKPVDMTGARIAMVHALCGGGDVQSCDAQSAYCQAPLKGAPKWLTIPPVLREILGTPSNLKQPVCRMHKALYGLVRAGFDWSDHCEEKLTANGWTRCWEGEKNIFSKVYTHNKTGEKHRIVLVVYVDDFIAGGHKETLQMVWKEIGELFAMDPSEPLDRFLGVKHSIAEVGYTPDGRLIRCLKMDQVEYCQTIVKQYKESMGLDLTKKLRYVSTPLDGTWPTEQQCPNWSDPGFHAPDGAKWNGRLLYLSRMTRGDIATAVGRLSRQLTAWTKYTDYCLHRLISYLDTHDSYELRVFATVGSDWDMQVYVDADHAGDPLSAKSTTGIATTIRSKDRYTRGTLGWGSRRQMATAWSSGESECVALSEATRPALVHLLVAEAIADRPVHLYVADDSSACIGAVMKGYSSMQYIEKTQKVRLGCLHDVYTQPGHTLIKWPTGTNTADTFTKPLEREPFEFHRNGLGIVHTDSPLDVNIFYPEEEGRLVVLPLV